MAIAEIEVNGQIFELEIEEGVTDEQITQFVTDNPDQFQAAPKDPNIGAQTPGVPGSELLSPKGRALSPEKQAQLLEGKRAQLEASGQIQPGGELLQSSASQVGNFMENLTAENPELAELVKNTGVGQQMLIGAGQNVGALLSGAGILPTQSPEDKVALDTLKGATRGGVGLGQAASATAITAIPGARVAQAVTAPARLAGGATLGALESGLIASGEGRDPVTGALLGAAIGGPLSVIPGSAGVIPLRPTAGNKRIAKLIAKGQPSETLDQLEQVVKTQGDSGIQLKKISQILKGNNDAHPSVTEIKQLVSGGGDTDDIIEGVFERVLETKGAANETGQFMLDGAGIVRSDPLSEAAIGQGFEPGAAAAIKGSSNVDKRRMRRMVSILERGTQSKRVKHEFRPGDVVGDSILDRWRTVKDMNVQSGRDIDAVADTLKGQRVDFSQPMNTFLKDLEKMGASITTDGKSFKGNFSGSDIEGLTKIEGFFNRVFNRLGKGGQDVDAHDIHRVKRFIDEQVIFGKNLEGLGGKAESTVKRLRRNLDQVLDSNFPAYDKVNTKYADTITALKNFSSSAGSKFDPFSENADKFVGTLSRRLGSNAQSRVPIMDSIAELQSVSARHGKKFKDDILTQAMFADELEAVFGAASPTSFLGDLTKAVETGAGRRGVADVGTDVVKAAAKKARGINEKNAIKAIKALLERR